jgi:glycerol-3-phosphate cytidylyltransferase-like family protein
MNPTKGNPQKREPVMSWQERAEMVKYIKGVDQILLYQDDETLRVLDSQGLWQIHFMGEDHRGEHWHKTPIEYISRNHDYSTTNLIKKINEHFNNRQ